MHFSTEKKEAMKASKSRFKLWKKLYSPVFSEVTDFRYANVRHVDPFNSLILTFYM